MPQLRALSQLRLFTLGAGTYSCANPYPRTASKKRGKPWDEIEIASFITLSERVRRVSRRVPTSSDYWGFFQEAKLSAAPPISRARARARSRYRYRLSSARAGTGTASVNRDHGWYRGSRQRPKTAPPLPGRLFSSRLQSSSLTANG